MADTSSSYWQTGFNLINNLATSGAFGSDGQKIAGYINPPAPIAAPNPAPAPAPVPQQQSVNPDATPATAQKNNWPMYGMIAGGVVVVLVLIVALARK